MMQTCLSPLLVLFLLAGAMVAAFSPAPYASGHGVSTCLQSRFVRLENEQFSSNSTVVGEPITVTGELKSLVNRKTTVSLIPVDREKIIAVTGDKDFFAKCNSDFGLSPSDVDDIAAEWQIVNASYSADPRAQIDIEPGGTVPFSIEIESADPGTFGLVTGYVVTYTQLNGTETRIIYLGRGQTVQVQPTTAQMQTCRELGIPEDRCSDRAIIAEQRLHDSYWIVGFPVQYFIGVGAAVAAIVAFVVLKRSR